MVPERGGPAQTSARSGRTGGARLDPHMTESAGRSPSQPDVDRLPASLQRHDVPGVFDALLLAEPWQAATMAKTTAAVANRNLCLLVTRIAVSGKQSISWGIGPMPVRTIRALSLRFR
jgi:hypothetical protein